MTENNPYQINLVQENGTGGKIMEFGNRRTSRGTPASCNPYQIDPHLEYAEGGKITEFGNRRTSRGTLASWLDNPAIAARTIHVGQRQWAASTSDDPKNVLATFGMGPCFALVVYEPTVKCGGMSHIDNSRHLGPTLASIVDSLDRAGGNEYQLTIVNHQPAQVGYSRTTPSLLDMEIRLAELKLQVAGKLKGPITYRGDTEFSFDLSTGAFLPFYQPTDEDLKQIHAEMDADVANLSEFSKTMHDPYRCKYLAERLR